MHGIGSDDPLVSYDGAGTTSPTYLLADERGSIMAETNSAGTVTTKHQYGPYGEPINQSASRFRYTGQILLPGTALYHYKARVYHPKLGRFLQTDPIGYKDGMNWYAYVGNDPMNAVDPDGKSLKLLKAAFNIAKRMLKGDSGKDAIKGEAADVVDNVRTLTDGEFGLDDAIAAVDLATGFGKEAGDLVGAAKGANKAPDFIVSPGGTAFPVPQGATGPTPVVNPSGNQTGVAFTGGSGGANGKVATMRIMNPTPARGKSPGYPNGYVKYENAASPKPQGVDPYSGKTLPNTQSHFPIN